MCASDCVGLKRLITLAGAGHRESEEYFVRLNIREAGEELRRGEECVCGGGGGPAFSARESCNWLHIRFNLYLISS